MQSVMKLEKTGNRVYQAFAASILISAGILLFSWNDSLCRADATICKITIEAKQLDADTKTTAQAKDVIWKNQMQPQLDDALLCKAVSPFSAIMLFAGFCLARYLIFSKRFRERLEEILEKADNNEYSHLKALAIGAVASAMPVLLVLTTSLNFKLAFYFASFWFPFIYLALAPLNAKKQ